VTVAMAFAGVGIYSAVNTVLGFFIFFAALSQGNSSGGSTNPVALVAVGAAILVIVGLVAGIGLLFVRKPWATGMGLGLMIGWALWSITTAGFCTGINPGLYG
jgi:Ni,Fe-hydrogenase I cytochrome b subunit